MSEPKELSEIFQGVFEKSGAYEGERVMTVFSVLTVLNLETGREYLSWIGSQDLPMWTAIGMLESTLADLKAKWIEAPEHG
jgi:hypothetical protein